MKSTGTSNREPRDSYWTDILERVRVTEIALILTVPSVITAVFLLPESIQQSLALDYGNPSLFNIWTATYVHRGFDHFSNNLVAYVLFIVPTYLLFLSADERKLFRYSFLSFLIVLPAVLALMNIAVIGQGTGAGFSGIGAAFIGLLLVSLFSFIQKHVLNEVGASNGTPVFLIALGFIAWIYSGLLITSGILIVSCLLFIDSIRSLGLDEVRRAIYELRSMNGHSMLVVVAFVLFMSSPILLFPQQITQDGNAVNIFSHYTGLVFGFFGPTMLSSNWEYSQKTCSLTQENSLIE